jgi:hypothetical protein
MKNLLLISLLAGLALAVPSAAADEAKRERVPKIHGVQYYEDTEDGKRHNVLADVSRKPIAVSAKANGVRTEGRVSGHIGPGSGPAKSWFFRDKKFVKAFLADLHDDGVAKLKVWAANDAGVTRKRCRMKLETDPLYGDSAEGDCRRF